MGALVTQTVCFQHNLKSIKRWISKDLFLVPCFILFFFQLQLKYPLLLICWLILPLYLPKILGEDSVLIRNHYPISTKLGYCRKKDNQLISHSWNLYFITNSLKRLIPLSPFRVVNIWTTCNPPHLVIQVINSSFAVNAADCLSNIL